MLIATDMGKPVYEKLGFHTVTTVHKCLAERFNSPAGYQSVYEIRPLTDADFDAVRELDRAAIGADRVTFLRARIQQAKLGIVARNQLGERIGFGLSILGPAHLVLGPIVAPNHEIASAIIAHLASGHQGSIRLDVPNGQEALLPYLLQSGFKILDQSPVMIRNTSHLPARNQTLFGFASLAFG